MANENDVVRLKHLQPLVSGVANDFSIQNGDNAVRLKHLVSLATALDNDKQTPVLSLGSWSAVDTVYSAPITYTGDGTLSTDIGTIANDILTVEDVDGNFSGVISATGGDDFNDTFLAFNFQTNDIAIDSTISAVSITSFNATSDAITLTGGNTDSIGIQVATSPAYLLNVEPELDWVTVEGDTLTFAPTDSVAAGNYSITVTANTSGDEETKIIDVAVKKPANLVVTPTQITWGSKNYPCFSTSSSLKAYSRISISYNGPARPIILNGMFPHVAITGGSYYRAWSYESDTNKIYEIFLFAESNSKITNKNTGSGASTLEVKVQGNDEYQEESVLITCTGTAATTSTSAFDIFNNKKFS